LSRIEIRGDDLSCGWGRAMMVETEEACCGRKREADKEGGGEGASQRVVLLSQRAR